PATLVFDHPNPMAVTQLLLTEIGGGPEEKAPSPFEEELQRLEGLLITVANDGDRLAEVEPRLRYLSNRLRTVLSAAGGSQPADTDQGADDDLDAVSDDDMFELIDKELGSA
ncbi:hypothetical protein RKE29_30350, partial [Streptomyces sp. B1866]|nr:hypothetical protein [Streptomyces sp. B1866]